MINSDQIRAARALLHLEQRELAEKARVSVATVRRVEAVGANVRVSPRAIASVQHALEAAGAEFAYLLKIGSFPITICTTNPGFRRDRRRHVCNPGHSLQGGGV